MTRKTKIWLIAVAIVVVFAIVGWFLGPALKLKGGDLWTLRIGLWVLGLVAAGVVLWFYLKAAAPAPATGDAARVDDIDQTMAAARAQLAAARTGTKGTISRLPLILVLGPQGSAKTTTVVRSGLDPELLAGGVSRDETVAPTRGVNVWFTHGTVIVEAGGPLVTEPARFARVLRHIQPRRVGAVLGRGSQAPRTAVVCVSCEELLRPGASESAPALARAMHTRLSEAARALGIRLPVYVLFTKTDRVSCFADYVRNLSSDEARQVLGATLPGEAGAAGLYADRQGKRLGEAFQRLFQSLAEKRLQFLAREASPEPKPGAYEFPRELRKAMPLATQFLVELCKPSELQVSPFLRGFYFAGVRPVFINEAAPSPAASVAARGAAAASSATQVFGAEQAAAQQRAPAAAPVTRKVPQWVFLGRLFAEVILGDRAAMAVTMGGARVNTLRRVLLGAAAAVGLFFIVGLVASYSNNRALQHDVIESARGVAVVAAPGASGPSLEALQRLDTLRADLQQLRDYEQNGAPLGLRFGLYSGSALIPDGRRAYFAAFDSLLMHDTWAGLTRTLAAVPDAPRPTDPYDSTYRTLKAYLITTTNPERSSEDFLAPVLTTTWTAARNPDSARVLIAQRQFAFYANELRIRDPFAVPADPAIVGRARTFLRQFTGTEPIYQAMLAAAGRGIAPIQFNRQVPGSAAFVVDRYTVPGAFTKAGYAAMQRALANADQFFQGERWVLGDEPPSQMDKKKAVVDLRQRYETDYVSAWRDYLQNATVVRPGSVREAAGKLQQVAGNQSPLLALFSIASQNTAVDTSIGNALQPVHVLVPPGQTDKLIGPPVQPYMTALTNLQASLDQLASAPPAGAEAQIATASQNASSARVEAQKIAQQFQVGREPAISSNVQRLLNEPIAGMEGFLRNYGAGPMNAKGAGFCSRYGSLFAKVPFNPRSPLQASVEEVSAVFNPGTGALQTYYNEALQNVLAAQGASFAPKPGGSLTVNPAFLSFFNRAWQFGAAIFPQGSTEPHMVLTLKPVNLPGRGTLAVTVEGDTHEYSAQMRPYTFTWRASPNGEATIAIRQPSGPVTIASFHGPWSIFQLFDAAASWQPSGNDYRVEWNIPGSPSTARISFDVELNNLPPVLRRGFFAGFSCVSRVVQ